MKREPAVSVIIPVYSGKQYFAELLPLLLNQTLQNMEFIFIDDRGTDDSFSLAEEAAKQDSRIILLRNEQNRGPGQSRNHGLSVAKGEYIAFADSDDIIPLDFYERLHSKAKETGALVVKCGRANRYVDGKIEVSTHNRTITEKLKRGEHLVNAFGWEHTTAIYQRTHVLNNAARNSDARQDEDTTFILGATHNLPSEKFAMIEDLFYYYRVSPDSLTRQLDENYLTESIKSMVDKLDYISERLPSQALEVYISRLLEDRVNWRIKHTMHEPRITKCHKEAYLRKVVDIAKEYLAKLSNLRLHGVAKSLITGNLSVDSYIQQLATCNFQQPSVATSSSASAFDAKKLSLIIHKSWVRQNYWRYKILSLLTFGSRRRKYTQKKRLFKSYIRIIRTHDKMILQSLSSL